MSQENPILALTSSASLTQSRLAGESPSPLMVEGMPAADIAGVLRRLLRYSWLIALITLLGGAAGWGCLKILPRIFISTATIKVEQERKALVAATNDLSGGREDIRALEVLKTIEQGLTSQNNLLRVIEACHLRDDPTFAPPVPGLTYADADLIAIINKRVKAELRRGTRLIDVKVEDTNPERARQLALSVVDEYMRASNDEFIATSRGQAATLRSEVKRLSEQMEESNAALQDYREQHKELPLDKDENLIADKLKQLNAQLTTISARRASLESALKQVEALGPDPDLDTVLKVQGVAENQSLSKLKNDVATKEAEFAKLKERYGPRHPKYAQAAADLVAVRAGLSEASRHAASTLAADCQHAAETERGLQEQIQIQSALSLDLARVAAPYRAMLSQIESDRVLYESVVSRLRQAEVAAAAAPVSVSLADRPVAASSPAKPDRKLIMAVALAAGGLLGTALVLMGGLFSRRFAGVEDAERELRIAALAVLPRMKFRTLREGLLGEPEIESRGGEPFRSLRAALTFAGAGTAAKSLLFTSATPGEGTSFVAMNYAVSLARQGFRTLLVDANLHCSSLDEVFFERPNPSGLANYLEGQPGSGKACRPTHVPELYLLSAGESYANPSELLSGRKMGLLFEDAQKWFHKIVVDAPSLTGSSDTLLMARHADSVILVVNAQTADKSVVKAAVRRLGLSGVSPAGFVFNAAALAGAAWAHAPAPARPFTSSQIEVKV